MSPKRQYKKMMRKYKRILKKHVKKLCFGDYLFGLEPFVDFLRGMKEFYEIGYNVWAMERKDEDPENYKDAPTRAESLKETIFYYDKWQNVASDYYKIASDDKEAEHYLKLGFYPDEDRKGTFRLFKDKGQNIDECNKAEKDYKHKFFECLEKHIEEWWD